MAVDHVSERERAWPMTSPSQFPSMKSATIRRMRRGDSCLPSPGGVSATGSWSSRPWVVVLIGLSVPGPGHQERLQHFLLSARHGLGHGPGTAGRGLPAQAADSDTIVWQVSHGTVRDVAVTARMAGVLRQIGAMPEVAAVASPYGPHGAAQISRDGRIAYATVHFTGTGRPGRSPKPAPPPGCVTGHRSPRSSCGTAARFGSCH